MIVLTIYITGVLLTWARVDTTKYRNECKADGFNPTLAIWLLTFGWPIFFIDNVIAKFQ